jgi:hypothetical protein
MSAVESGDDRKNSTQEVSPVPTGVSQTKAADKPSQSGLDPRETAIQSISKHILQKYGTVEQKEEYQEFWNDASCYSLLVTISEDSKGTALFKHVTTLRTLNEYLSRRGPPPNLDE